jgi:HCOMODA/2-hydroxy-3-carboxy-muconic semialdehyde decarboxylase
MPEEDLAADVGRELVLANHVLAAQNIVDAFGHVSLRHPDKPDHFLLSRSKAPALVEMADLILLDTSGTPADREERRPLFLERFIHSAIYQRRPDVTAIVHSHSPRVIPFGLVPGIEFRPVSHLCGFLMPPAAVFEIRDHAGDATDLLIRDAPLGEALARTLGAGNVVLMRGHGMTTVGNSLRAAVFHAVLAERNAELLSAALRLGEPIYLSAAEAARCRTTTAGQIDRAWNMWLRELEKSGMPGGRG